MNSRQEQPALSGPSQDTARPAPPRCHADFLWSLVSLSDVVLFGDCRSRGPQVGFEAVESGRMPRPPSLGAVPAAQPREGRSGPSRFDSPSPPVPSVGSFGGLATLPLGEQLGVKNDVNETVLRAVSRLSDTELQLRSLSGSEEEQLRQLRARHQQNLESLGMLQKSMLVPSAAAPFDAMTRERTGFVEPSPRSMQLHTLPGASALLDLANASTSFPETSGPTGLGAGPLPPTEGFLPWSPQPPSPPSPQRPEPRAPEIPFSALTQTAGPLPPPSQWMSEDATESLAGELIHRKVGMFKL